jgi:hypothetical protein
MLPVVTNRQCLAPEQLVSKPVPQYTADGNGLNMRWLPVKAELWRAGANTHVQNTVGRQPAPARRPAPLRDTVAERRKTCTAQWCMVGQSARQKICRFIARRALHCDGRQAEPALPDVMGFGKSAERLT